VLGCRNNGARVAVDVRPADSEFGHAGQTAKEDVILCHKWVVAVSRFEQSVGVPSPYLPIAWTPPSSNTPWVTTSITQSLRHRDLSKHGDKNRSTTHPTSPDSVSLFWNDRDQAATVDTFTRGIPDVLHERPMRSGDWWRGNADTLARPDRGPRQVDQQKERKNL